MEFVLALLLIGLVAAFVLAPLRREPREGVAPEDATLEDLEARKRTKYREIRDAELDHAQGKLDDEEFELQNAELRREAIEILRAIDERKRGDL